MLLSALYTRGIHHRNLFFNFLAAIISFLAANYKSSKFHYIFISYDDPKTQVAKLTLKPKV